MDAKLIGKIVILNSKDNSGIIMGENGIRYFLTIRKWKAIDLPILNDCVEFIPVDNNATNINKISSTICKDYYSTRYSKVGSTIRRVIIIIMMAPIIYYLIMIFIGFNTRIGSN